MAGCRESVAQRFDIGEYTEWIGEISSFLRLPLLRFSSSYVAAEHEALRIPRRDLGVSVMCRL